MIRPTLALAAALLLGAPPALAAPYAHIRYAVDVLDVGSSTGTPINHAEAGQRVQVWECDRGNVYCRVRILGPDGWVPSGALRMDIVQLPCTGLAKCLPMHGD